MPQQLSLFNPVPVFKERPLKTLTACNYRKEHGVFYTDLELAKCILRFLRISKETVIFDPNCGQGRFLSAGESLGYHHMTGCDIDAAAIEVCKQQLQTDRVYTMDTIWTEPRHVLQTIGCRQKVGAIVGNPPFAKLSKYNTPADNNSPLYQWTRRAGNNLFVASIRQDFDYVEEGGIVSLIVPKNLLYVNSYQSIRQYLLQHKTIVSVIDLGAVFKDVRGEQIVLTMRNKEPRRNTIRFYQYKGGKITPLVQAPQQLFTDTLYLFHNTQDIALYKKLSNIPVRLEQLCTGYIGRGKSNDADAIAGKDIRKYGLKTQPTPHSGNQVFVQNIYSRESGIIACFAGNLKARQTVTVITDGNEGKCKYITGLLHSRLINFFLIKYCYNSSTLTMHTDAKYLKRIPIAIDESSFHAIVALTESQNETEYLSDEWLEKQRTLDQLTYQAYGITAEEAAYIDEQMAQLQSRKWNYEHQSR